MNVLLVKLSSMGDLIHALPAISDAAEAKPGIRFDWVIERAFQEVAQWHPNVDQVIPSAHRYWKKNIRQSLKNGELQNFWRQLRSKKYDLIIDAQSSYKSALVTRLARGLRVGMDAKSVRETGAHWVLKRRYAVEKQQHAITRLRQLFAQALNYPCPETKPNFALRPKQFPRPSFALPEQYLVFLTNASWLSKCYPEPHWEKLIHKAAQQYDILLPWGSAKERERVERIAAMHPRAHALPRLSLSEIGYVLSHAKGAISVDTGLGHLSAALNTPTVTLYGPTDPTLIGATGEGQMYLQPDFPCTLCYKTLCHYQGENKPIADCMQALHPENVWQHFLNLQPTARPAVVTES